MKLFKHAWFRRRTPPAEFPDNLVEAEYKSFRRFFQLTPRLPTDPQAKAAQFEALRYAFFSLIQDVVTLKAYLAERGLWNAKMYERLRREVIEGDAYTGGADWILHHSYVQYFLDPNDLLRYAFGASQKEADEWVEHLSWMMSRVT